MNARASNHSVVAEQWVRAWLAPQTVRVPSRKSRQDSERLSALEPAEYLRRLFDVVEFSYLVWWQRNWALPIFLHLAHG